MILKIQCFINFNNENLNKLLDQFMYENDFIDLIENTNPDLYILIVN